MAHDHSAHRHAHSHGHDHPTGNIVAAFWLNFLFCLLEFAGGIFTNSVAIISDALHDLGDSFSLGLAWYFQRFSQKKRDKYFSYGYKRFSLLGALINAIILVTGSIVVLTQTIPRLLEPHADTDAKGMMLFALLGIVVNGAAVLRLRKGSSLNERVVSLHLMEDVLGWVAILIGSIVMLFADLPVIDPILSLLITVYILFNVYRNMKDVFRVILQGIPLGIDQAELTTSMLRNLEIKEVHDLHIWTIDNEYHILTAHLVLASDMSMTDAEQLKKDVKQQLHDTFGIEHATLETEPVSGDCGLKGC